MGKTLGYGEITVANMTEPFTVMLTNEAQQFATDSNRKVTSAQSYYTDIIVIRGSQERTDYTIGNITSGSGITVSKSSKRVTFNVSAGTTIGADTGVIEIPITLDGQTVKKQFSWSCGKQGPQGVKGQDGTSIKITSKSVTYQTSISGTTAPTGTWSTTVPTVNNGQYLWTKTTVQYSDGNKTEAYSVSYKGTNGTNGTSVTVSKTEVTYQVSTSGTTAPTGTWSTIMPSCDQGQYLWTKTYVKYSDGKETTSYSVSYKGVDGEKFSWNLIKYGKGDVKKGFFKDFNKVENGYGELTLTSKKSYQGLYISDGFVVPVRNYPVGSKLIWSYDIMYTKWDFPTGTNHQEFWLGQRYTSAPSGETATGQWRGVTSHSLPVVGQNGCELNKWLHVEAKMAVPEKASDNVGTENKFQFYNSGNDTATVTLRMKNVKLEYGDTATPWSPSQSDLEGRGVSETVQYYLATSQATGVASSTSGWSTDITTQKITATKKYLWNCSQTRYTDGTSEPITTPTIIGAYGDKGETGADGQDGAGFHWNLLKNSGDLSKMKYGQAAGDNHSFNCSSDNTTLSKNVVEITTKIANTGGTYFTGSNIVQGAVKKGNTYTVSCWCKCSSAKNVGVINAEFLDNKTYVTPKLSTEWQQYIVTGVANKDVTATSSGSAISFYYGSNMNVGDILYISSPKLEDGDKASPWCTTYEETLAKSITITPSAQIFKSTDGGNTFAPNQITITPTLQGEINFGKWQYSIDGGVSFADVVSGQSGLSVDANKTLTIAKTSGLFTDKVTMVTFRAVASDSSFYDTCSIAKLYDVTDIEIGGVNLIKNSNFANGVNKWAPTGITYAVETDSTYGHHIKFSSSVAGDSDHRLLASASDNFNHVKNTTYTLSFYAKASANTQVQSNVAGGANPCNYSLTTSWQRYTTTYKASAAGSLTFWAVEANKDIYLANIKLERGNKPTDYTVSPEDVQTAILSTKNSIDSVSSKVDTNTKSIQDKVSKTTYERELTLVKGDLSKANEGLNKWRYEIYPKSLFDSEDQSKSTIDIFARNSNLVPSQTVLLDDASLSTGMNYGDSHIAYALTFVKMSAKKDVTTKMFNDDGASLYVNGGLIITRPSEYTNGEEITFTLAQGWNCIEVVVNEEGGLEGFRFSTTLSKLSECEMMNCYYGTPVARQSRITNQLVDVTKNLTGVTSTVQDVMTAVGDSGNITEFKNNYSKWKQNVDKIEIRVGEQYVTNEKFDGLEIGGRNLLTKDDCNMSKWTNTMTSWIKVTNNEYDNIISYTTLSSGWEIIYKKISVEKGKKYVLSFDYKVNKAYSYLSGQKYGVYLSTSVPTNAAPTNIITDGQYVIENTVTSIKRGIVTFTAPADALYIVINGGCINDNQTGVSFEFNKWKLEKGNKATDWTPAPEDINGRITSVETIANQTADKFSWLVKSGTSSSNFELTDKTATLVASKINQYGLVTFNGLDDTTKDKINTITSGNLITVTPANPKSDYGGGQTYNVIADDKGGRCVQWNSSCASFLLLNSYTPVNFTSSDQLYYDIRVPNWGSTTFDTKLTIWFYNKNKANVTSASKTLTLKSTIWNHFTGYLTLPSSSNWGDLYYYIIGLTNPNKQAIGITNDSYIERVNSYATTYAKNAVNWVTNNGQKSQNLYSMVSKWTDGAVSDTTQINGGWIKANTITANKIAIGDFTNYADINESNTYWFLVEQTKEGTWFYRDGSALQRDNVISELHTCRGGEKFYVEYDISNTIKEGDEYKYAGLMIFGYDGNGGIVSYNRNAGVTATANGEITHITTQLTMPDTTRSFRVYLQIEGHTPFTGTLKIRNISVRKAVTGNLIVDGSITANKIATDAIKSRNYISSGGTQGSFLNLSDGSFKSPNLSWDSNGNLIAKNANLSGQITATKGKIGSFNLDKSLYLSNNSPYYFSQFCAKKVYGLTNEGDIYIGSEGIYSYSWETGNMYIGDSGSIQADVSSSRGVCIENGEIYIYKSDYCKDYPTAYDDKYGLILAGGYVASANYRDGGSIDSFNFILSPNKFNINGKIYASNELQTGGDQIRIISGNIGCMLRNDSADFYILRTNSGDPYGGWTNDRPFRINWASNDITCGHNLTANDLIANSWVYCSEVHSSGAVVIASDSESFYWAHGYQIARGTSWGGVCIGDDSQGLRLYGTSIWASHGISTSDENLKENFTTLDQYEDFYMNLNPIGFNYIGDYDGKKTHFGFGAHKTEDILESEGYDSDKFAVVTHRPLVQEDIEKRFGKDVEVDIETEYGISYTEFIALNTHMIQKTRRELTKVKQEKADLEARLQAIEAKLGL